MALIEIESGAGLFFEPLWSTHLRHRNNWCKENCEGYFTHRLNTMNCIWEFELEIDAMAFKLRWI